MSSKRKSTTIIEEEDDYSEASDLEIVEENDVSVGSGDDEIAEKEVNAPPMKKKSKNVSASVAISSKITSMSAKKQQAAFRKAEHQLSNYHKKISQVSRGGKGAKGVLAVASKVEFDFDELELSDMQDNVRQTITKKKHFPRGLVGVITRAERIDFSKDKKKDSRVELVVDVAFVYDIHNEAMKRTFEGEEIDYNEASIRLHLPKRYQDQLEGLNDLSLLQGGLVLCPNHDGGKWKDKKDEDKSSIPLIMLFKSRRALERFGLTYDTYPSVDEFIEEGQKLLNEDGYEADPAFKLLFHKSSTEFFC